MDVLKLLRPGMVLDLGFSRQGPWTRVESEVGEYRTPDGHSGEARVTMSAPRHTVIELTTGEPIPEADPATAEGRTALAERQTTDRALAAWEARASGNVRRETYVKEL